MWWFIHFSGSSDPGKAEGPSYSFFCVHITFHIRSSLLAIFISFFISHFWCNAQVFGRTLLHEFISYNHSEWYVLFSGGEMVLVLAKVLRIKY